MSTGPDFHIAMQLFSARKAGLLEESLRILAGLGYTHVEPAAPEGNATELASALKANGLEALSAHFSLHALEHDLPRVLRAADVLGLQLLIASQLPTDQRPISSDGWEAFGQRLQEIARRVAAAGFQFAWHNHDFEFHPMTDGTVPIDLILRGAVLWQADVAWIARAGFDPVDWLEKFKARLVALHVKDVAKPGESLDEDGWADVGFGMLQWPEILAAARRAGVGLLVAEHDNPSDFQRFARRTIQTVAAWRQPVS